MPMKPTYSKNEATAWPVPNYWDVAALVLVLGIIVSLAWGAQSMLGHYQLSKPIPISLDPLALPYYALRTVLRMLIALVCSVVFTLIFGTWAAKSPRAERIIIPMIDILQSVPILGLLPIAVIVFVNLFPNNIFGLECAAIFAIFTAQAWNITLSFYQSLRTVPHNLYEAADIFQLSAWQRFWRIDVPFAMPGLIWNMMLSMSSSWVYLVACEAITIAGQTVRLPGIGSYISLAIAQSNLKAIGYVILAMFIVIALYDQLLFRPLVAWAEKFKAEETASEETPESWVLELFQRTELFRFIGHILNDTFDHVVNHKWLLSRPHRKKRQHVTTKSMNLVFTALWWILFSAIVGVAMYMLLHFIFKHISIAETPTVLYFGLVTALRVTLLIILSSIIWVPIGVYIGLHPRASQIIQPIVQFLAAFPANLLFPLIVSVIVTYHLNVNIWTSPLMILGTQWYILFNVIAGTMAIPKNLRQAAGTLHVKGWLWWRRLALPAIFPYYITGAITAAGGAWNISIIAEAVSWGHTHLWATGLGAYITREYNQGDFPRLALGIVVMSVYVLLINRLIWRPLYNLAKNRYQIT